MDDSYKNKEEQYGSEIIRHLEKVIMLQTLDTQWKEHLAEMDYLRQGIGLRGYAQKNPKQNISAKHLKCLPQCLIALKARW